MEQSMLLVDLQPGERGSTFVFSKKVARRFIKQIDKPFSPNARLQQAMEKAERSYQNQLNFRHS